MFANTLTLGRGADRFFRTPIPTVLLKLIRYPFEFEEGVVACDIFRNLRPWADLMEDWGALLRDNHEGYITWDEFEVTMDRYGHLFPSDDHKKAMDRIARELLT